VGYEFTLTLNREIDEEESLALREGVCSHATFTSASLPPDGVRVTQLDFDTEAENLAVAIQSALDAVQAVPDLLVDTLDVPPQPSGLPDEDESAGRHGGPLELTAGPADSATSPTGEAPAGAGGKLVENVDLPEEAPAPAEAPAKNGASAKTRSQAKAKAQSRVAAPAKAKAPPKTKANASAEK
jgi:hypothetical protein